MPSHSAFSPPTRSLGQLLLALLLATVAALTVGFFLTQQAQADVSGLSVTAFEANLTAAQEVPPNSSTASGRAVLALEEGDTLYYRVLLNDIDNVTAAHIHTGTVGNNGGVAFTLFDGTGSFDPNHPVSGTLSINTAQVNALLNGEYYINVHTTEVPSGEVRGQIETFDTSGTYGALLLGLFQEPSVETDAGGWATIEFMNTNQISYTVTVTQINSITAAHIHKGKEGETGGVLVDLFTSGTFDPDNPLQGSTDIGGEALVDILTGYSYVNVHTTAYPAGEIRGQVASSIPFGVELSGENEVPPVETAASGAGILALAPDGKTLEIRILTSDIMSVTAAHIHEGAAGSNGPVIETLYDGMEEWDDLIYRQATLTLGEVLAMVNGGLYVNIHTESVPSGEIRGQIDVLTDPPLHLTAFLRGGNEVPPVMTDATGTAAFTYRPEMSWLFYNVQVSDIVSVTAAHIHQGLAGENGGVVFDLLAGDQSLDLDDPAGGMVMLSAEDLVNLYTESLYVNVHTSGTPSGEIRGQIIIPEMIYLPIAIAE